MDLVEFGQMLGHKSRADILMALMGGKALPAGELAYRAHVSCQTASSHLVDLVNHGMIRMRKCGRFHYYEISDNRIARLIEQLATTLSADDTVSQRVRIAPEMKKARLCYDHLAGELGVAVTKKLVALKALRRDEESFSIPKAGHSIYNELGVDIESIASSRRKHSPHCIDWSERVSHVGGALGCELAHSFLYRGYLVRSKDDRSVMLTAEGKTFFTSILNLGDVGFIFG